MNFALILFVLVVITGIIWAFDRFHARKQRAPEAPDPWWVEYGGSFFPVILAVFLLRSFLVEPFKIPSGSMIPTLLVGDFILVNKYTYGVRLPVINRKIVELNTPQRGDVVVFRYPPDPSLDYIKRVVGLPGDKVVYRNKKLTINGLEIAQKKTEDYLDRDRLFYTPRFVETLGSVEHHILVEAEAPGFVQQIARFPHSEKCNYNSEGVSCEVPPGHYFMMGDNRDNSQDSRFWGFVPDENLVGKAFFIWFNFSDLKRIGSFH
ncbi:MAG: signal peptidase I [Sulfuritalea sp.]|jgi:signal peptidase I|nr:signal peptidase I [Sulfuritalea sp.]